MCRMQRKPSIRDYCVQSIERYIYERGMLPGSRLPSLGSMCKLFGVSLTSLREAVKLMELRGNLEIRNGVGVFVQDAACAGGDRLLSDSLPSVQRFGSTIEMKKRFINMLEVRKMIERQIIENIIRTASDEELLGVQDCVDRLMFNYHNGLPTTAADQIFHSRFIMLCGNDILLQLAKTALSLYSRMWDNSSTDMDFLFADTVPMHEKLFFHIRSRDLRHAQQVNDETVDLIFSRLVQA